MSKNQVTKPRRNTVLTLQQLTGVTLQIPDDVIYTDADEYIYAICLSAEADGSIKIAGDYAKIFRALVLISGGCLYNPDELLVGMSTSKSELSSSTTLCLAPFIFLLASNGIIAFDGISSDKFPKINYDIFNGDVSPLSLPLDPSKWDNIFEMSKDEVLQAKALTCTTSEVCCSSSY